MTRRAALTAPAAGDPFARVAGLTVVLRQLLSLQDAGVTEVDVDLAEPVVRALAADPRLTMRVRARTPGDPAPGLTAPLGLVWHRALPARLTRAGFTGDIGAAPLAPGEFVIAATDAASRRAAGNRLLQSLIKPTDGFISRAINRRISLQVTRALLDTGLTPNQMTWIAALFGGLAVGCVLAGGVAGLLPGALLLQVQSILDGCDGEISRLKYIRSRLGEWLDQVLDDLVNVGFFAATGWVLWQAGSTLAPWLTVAGTALHVVYQLSLYAGLLLRGGGSGSVTSILWYGQKDHVGEPPVSVRTPFTRFKEAVENAGRRDFFTFLYLPAALLGLPEVALAWCGIIFSISGLTTGLQWLLLGGPRPAVRTS